MTHERVRTVQGYFVTLVGGEGELDSRYAAAIPAGADRAGIDALAHRWQPMTARFAGLVGTMNDNVDDVAGVAALNDVTRPLGFAALPPLGWFLVTPGVAVVVLALGGPLRRRVRAAPVAVSAALMLSACSSPQAASGSIRARWREPR
jgi:hypothetical protein